MIVCADSVEMGSNRYRLLSMISPASPHPVPKMKRVGPFPFSRISRSCPWLTQDPPSRAPVTTVLTGPDSSRPIASTNLLQTACHRYGLEGLAPRRVQDPSRTAGPVPDDRSYQVGLVRDRGHDEKTLHPVGLCRAGDVVDVGIRHGARDDPPFPVDHRVV